MIGRICGLMPTYLKVRRGGRIVSVAVMVKEARRCTAQQLEASLTALSTALESRVERAEAIRGGAGLRGAQGALRLVFG